MMKKLLSFLIVLVTLCSLFVVPVQATLPDAIDISPVKEDLSSFGIDTSKYFCDPSLDIHNKDEGYVQLLYFLEYGYTYSGTKSEYGLYLYLYNPSGKPLDVTEGNFVQIKVADQPWCKLPLELCNYYSEDNLYPFYKFKVGGMWQFASVVSRDLRVYEISGVEVNFQGETNSIDYPVSYKYSVSGFMNHCGPNRDDTNTLHTDVDDIRTVTLKLGSATWKTQTSDKGAGYAHEMFSAYFNVPNWVIREYGDENDPFKGLRTVTGTYEEYLINGLLTTNTDLYTDAYNSVVGVYVGKEYNKNIPFCFSSINPALAKTFNFNPKSGTILETGIAVQNSVPSLSFAIEIDGETEYISNDKVRDVIYEVMADKGGLMYLRPDNGTIGFQHYSVNSSTSEDLRYQMATYASSTNAFKAWLTGNSKLFIKDEKYDEILPIIVVDPDDVNDGSAEEAAALFVHEDDMEGLKDTVESSVFSDCTTYLMRFAVRDYFFSKAQALDHTKVLLPQISGDHYYMEKTIFENFDIITLEYENAYGVRTVLPVVCSPIDIYGSITSTIGNKFPGDNGDGVIPPEAINWLAIVLGVLLVVLFVFLFSKIVTWLLIPVKGISTLRQEHLDRRRKRLDIQKAKQELEGTSSKSTKTKKSKKK